MSANLPDVAHTRDGRTTVIFREGVRRARIVSFHRQAADQSFNFRRFEPGKTEIEVEIEFSEEFEFVGQLFLIPGAILRQLVVGDDVRPDLRLAQAAQLNGRYFLKPYKLRCLHAPVAGNENALLVDQYWDGEAICSD